MWGAKRAMSAMALSATSSRRVSQLPCARRYGTYCAKMLITCLPGGATLPS